MPAITFTDEDIKAGFLVQNPGRYKYELSNVKVKPAKTDGSPNYTFVFKGLDGEMAGVSVFYMASSKAGWLIAPIVKAANGGKAPVPGQKYEIDDLKGVVLTAMTARGQREDGTYFNSLSDFKPVE
jgi:hypothetical protein